MTVVGYSMGGMIAQTFWQRHRELTAGLVLCATARNVSGSFLEQLTAMTMPFVVGAMGWIPPVFPMRADLVGGHLLGDGLDPRVRRAAHVPTAYNVLASGSEEQIDRWLRPALRGELHDAYAVTEEHAGSDPSGIATTAVRSDGGWVIDGEKWFVTYGTVAAVYIVVAIVPGEGPTLFLVPRETPGVEIVEDPAFTHTYPHGHPTIRFRAVEVPDDAVIGGVGAGDDLQRAWFTEERIGIAARGVGAMWRLLEEATAWAIEREQGGARIFDHQGVSFPLADSAADAAAGRALGLEVARLADAGADPKIVHAKASMAKLFVSEAAYRCADRCVQVFGGRGYLRSNVAERFLRELRVDRIWEGTSEIQRLIVARALERRGVERTIH